MISVLTNVPGFYQTQDVPERIRLVNQYRFLWMTNTILNWIFLLITMVGVALLSVHLWRSATALSAAFGGIAYGIGSVMYAFVLFSRSMDLPGYLEGKFPDYHVFGNWFVLAGLFLLGIAFLKAGLPTWLSYLTMGISLLLAGVLLIWPAFFLAIPFLVMGLLFVVGIVLLRR